MSEMTVSELGRRTGTTPDTIRYYERIGLLPDVARSPAGYRLFDAGMPSDWPSSRGPRASGSNSTRSGTYWSSVTGACARAGMLARC